LNLRDADAKHRLWREERRVRGLSAILTASNLSARQRPLIPTFSRTRGEGAASGEREIKWHPAPPRITL